MNGIWLSSQHRLLIPWMNEIPWELERPSIVMTDLFSIARWLWVFRDVELYVWWLSAVVPQRCRLMYENVAIETSVCRAQRATRDCGRWWLTQPSPPRARHGWAPLSLAHGGSMYLYQLYRYRQHCLHINDMAKPQLSVIDNIPCYS